MTDAASVTLNLDEATVFAAGLLQSSGVPAEDAEIAASALVRADLRGIDTHGIVRLPGYMNRLDKGLVTAAPQLTFDRITPSVARLDGQDGLGFVIASRAIDEAVTMAQDSGIALIGVRNSTHFGMAATYLLKAVEAGCLAMVFTNASRALPPWGGTEEMFGTSPFAAAAPNAGGLPFILDMAPTVVARGKIRKAAREGREIPDTWALDGEGRPTTDPDAALKGTLLPIGGPKGAGLSMLMDILCGVLTGANFAGGVGDQYKNFDRPQGVGHFILAMKPDLFISAAEFTARMAELVATVKANPRAIGVQEIYMPGEPEARIETVRRTDGIPYRRVDLEPLEEIARGRGVALPASLSA